MRLTCFDQFGTTFGTHRGSASFRTHDGRHFAEVIGLESDRHAIGANHYQLSVTQLAPTKK